MVITGYDIPTDSTPGACAVNCTNNNEIYSFHDAGANILMCDGSVRLLKAQTDINIVIHLTTRAMGDPLPPDF